MSMNLKNPTVKDTLREYLRAEAEVGTVHKTDLRGDHAANLRHRKAYQQSAAWNGVVELWRL